MAPLTEIVAFFEKKIQGAFWRFSGQKRALSDSKHLATLLFDFGIRRTLVRRQASEIKDKNFIWILGRKKRHLKREPCSFQPNFWHIKKALITEFGEHSLKLILRP